MRRFGVTLVILFLMSFGSAHNWEVTLTSGQTYSPVRLDWFDGNTLHFNMGSYGISISLEAIARIRFLNRYRLRLWGFAGGVAGFYGGFLGGKWFAEKIFEMPLEPKEDPVVLFPAATGAVLGTVLALDHARRSGKAIVNPDYDFSQMTLEEKVTTLQEIMQLQERPLFFKLISYFN